MCSFVRSIVEVKPAIANTAYQEDLILLESVVQ